MNLYTRYWRERDRGKVKGDWILTGINYNLEREEDVILNRIPNGEEKFVKQEHHLSVEKEINRHGTP